MWKLCFNGHFAQVQVFSPSSTWTVQNSPDNADAERPLTQDFLVPLIHLTTGHWAIAEKYSVSHPGNG